MIARQLADRPTTHKQKGARACASTKFYQKLNRTDLNARRNAREKAARGSEFPSGGKRARRSCVLKTLKQPPGALNVKNAGVFSGSICKGFVIFSSSIPIRKQGTKCEPGERICSSFPQTLESNLCKLSVLIRLTEGQADVLNRGERQ